MVCESEVKEGVLRVNCAGCVYGSSIEDFEACMAMVIDKLAKDPNVDRIVLAETRENEYDSDQTRMLVEIANAYRRITDEDKLLGLDKLGTAGCEQFYPKRLADVQFLVMEALRKDPVGAYVRLTRMITRENAGAAMAKDEASAQCYIYYVQNSLEPIKRILESCRLIQLAVPMLNTSIAEYKPGDRRVYRELFHPVVRPNFMLTRYMVEQPKGGRLMAKYYLGSTNTLVQIFKIPGRVRYKYHITPAEFRLPDDKYAILDAARRYLAEHRPSEREISEPDRARELFKNVGAGIIKDIAAGMRVQLNEKEVDELAIILARYTAGFGVLELVLGDDKVQDIYVNSPIGTAPIYIYHADFEECETNLIPTKEDAEAWATRFRLYSGRPLDEANPVLDTELIVPGGRARVAAITRSLSPDGLAFAFRRHREKPWTFPLFMQAKFIDPLYAGLMSFIIDGGRACLIAGGRSSGKTSLLGAMMLELMRKNRLIVQEDSVTGDCNIVVNRDGKFERTTVGRLIDGMIEKYGCRAVGGREILHRNLENVKIFAMNADNKVVLSPVSSFIRHKAGKDIFEVKTRTGRMIKVTGDHSLFTMSEDGKVSEAKVRDLRVGSYLVTPRILPMRNSAIGSINILDYLERMEGGFVFGQSIRKFLEENMEIAKKVATGCGYSNGKCGYPKNALGYWKRSGVIPSKVLAKMLDCGCKIDEEGLEFKINTSKPLPVRIELDEDMLTLIGLWLADGCYDRWNVIVSLNDDGTREAVYRIGEKFGIRVGMCTDGFSLKINSKALKILMKDVLDLRGNAYTKRMPDWIYELSRDQIATVLRGVFSGDGYLAKAEAAISLVSLSMIKDIQTLLLTFGIVSRINRMKEKDKTYSLRISSQKMLRPFFEEIGFLQKKRMETLGLLGKRISTHDTTDVVPFGAGFKNGLASMLPRSLFNSHDYVARGNHIGREKLNDIVSKFGRASQETMQNEAIQNIESLVRSDIFWDEVKSIKCLGKIEGYVYDFSVPGRENFICENILAHNTLELPVVQMRQMGYNVSRLKSRSVITHIETELPADEALRTALRLGDSVLILGEVRSVEGKALFEAMRIGALANFVAGTIHGESAYGVYDRIVNDLGVPNTSFKAIDLITICSMLNSPDGLHRFRRVTGLTEVRKHWRNDPDAEGGFVNLMEYSAKEDRLKPTAVLTDGESEVLNGISERVREWHGRWEDVWDNIQLRARIKETMVRYAVQLKRPGIMEADWTVESNEMMHILADQVKQEVGSLDSRMIYGRWEDWLKAKLKSAA